MAAVLQHRELSGAFSDEAKWQECWNQLSSAGCSISTLRIYHNSQQQLLGTAQALLHNSTVTQLDIGVVDGLDAAQGLSGLLKTNHTIQTLAIQELSDASTAAAAACPVLQALTCNSTIRCLTLHKLQPGQLQQLAAALAAGGCGCNLQQLNLPGARLDAPSAAALSAALCSQPHLTHLGLKGATFTCQHQQQPDPEQQQQQQQQQQPEHSDCQQRAALSSCAVGQLFGPALAAHPSLSHVCLQAATASASSRGSNDGSSGSSRGVCWYGLGTYIAAAAQLQELLLSEAGLGDADLQQLGQGLAAAAAAAPAAVHSARILLQAAGGDSRDSSSSSSSSRRAGIRVLDLSGNSMGAEGATALGCGLGFACCRLETLKLGGNKMGPEGVSGLVVGVLTATATSAAAAAGECAESGAAGAMSCLQELDLSANAITDATGLQQLLSQPLGQGLLTLNLKENCLDDSAVQLIASALGSTATGTVSSSTVSSTTSGNVSPRSPRSPSSSSSSRVLCKLTHLNLSHNWIKDGGAKALTALLQYPSSSNLSTLLLHHNRMSRAGVEGLADAAVGNRRVLDLQLQGNRALGRLQALEDLKLVLADRLRKQQQQQQDEGDAKTPVSHSHSSRCSPLSSPREQAHSVSSTATAAAAAAGGGPGNGNQDSHWQSPLLSPRSSGSVSALRSPFASVGAAAADPAGTAGTAAIAAAARAAGSTEQSSSSSSSRGSPVAGAKRGLSETSISDPVTTGPAGSGLPASAGARVDGQAVVEYSTTAGRRPKARPAAAAAAAPAAESVAADAADDADMADAAAHIVVSGASGTNMAAGSKPAVPNKPAAVAAASAAAAPSYLFKSAAAAAAAAAFGSSAGQDAAGCLSFQLPSLAGRFLQQQQLGLCERSFSFDQWCEDNALQLGGWGSLGDSIGEGYNLGGSFEPTVVAQLGRGAQGGVKTVTRLASAAAPALPATASSSGDGQQQQQQQGAHGLTEPLPSESGASCLLLEEDSLGSLCGSTAGFDSSSSGQAGMPAAGHLAGRFRGSSSSSSSSSSNGHLLGQALCSVGVDGAAAVLGEAVAAMGPVVQGVGRVSSLSGWMSDQGFVQAGRELLLPGVRRKYMIIHGAWDSSDGGSSSSRSDGKVAGAESQQQQGVAGARAFSLRPSGSNSGEAGGRYQQANQPSGSDSSSSRHSKLVLGSATRAASGALRLQPKASAASLRFYASSDGGGSAGSSRSSSIGEEGASLVGVGSSSNRSSADGSFGGVGLVSQGSGKGVLLVRRGGSVGREVSESGTAGSKPPQLPSRLSVASKGVA